MKMQKLNIKNLLLASLALIILAQPCPAYREISGLLDDVKELSHHEINALRPLFEELQLQYDFIASKTSEEDLKVDEHLLESTSKEFDQLLNQMFPQEATSNYNTTLPTVEKVMGNSNFSLMTKEQQMEFLDMKSILQDALDEAQLNLNELVARALLLETNLLKINKPKIILFILKALQMGYKAAARVGRASYCTYSHIPQLNTSLHSLYDGVDCYLNTTSLIVKIQNEIYRAIKTVKKSVFELAAVYKKVASKNSLMGKIVSVILNVTKITKSILNTLRMANHVIDSVANQLPSAAEGVVNCSSDFIPKIPFVVQSVANVTECIFFVNNTKTDYDFMKPEEEYIRDLNNVIPDIADEDENDNADSK